MPEDAHESENEALSVRSGNVQSPDRLVSFLYELMRDHLTPGRVETMVRDSQCSQEDPTFFTNGYLANYAMDLAARLR